MAEIRIFIELLEKYRVVIPLVQRDYAQGRTDVHSTQVRMKLLHDMRRAITDETESLDLNFVYGKPLDDRFMPLDGQQRLTTLFLLHLYAFRDNFEQTNLLMRFSYETRTSSRKFLHHLVQHRNEVFGEGQTPSVEITDAEWFVSSWQFDPTVQSVLVMCDAIQEMFKDVAIIEERLNDRVDPPITFHFLDMENLSLEDSLYIKLNARGKPLTSFENFKARLIGRLEALDFPCVKTFEQRFDGMWTDFFWANYRNQFDTYYLAFFEVLFMNELRIQTQKENWENRFDYDCVNSKIFELTRSTLDYVSQYPETSASKIILQALEPERSYRDRILFHAVTIHITSNSDDVSLKQWIRVIKNLTLNSSIDTFELYKRALESVDQLILQKDLLLQYLATDGEVKGFYGEQIKEERLKARIILHDDLFAEAIYKAEEHPYFKGQIQSALNMAMGADSKDQRDLFKECWTKITALFESSKPIHGNKLRRALLTFGDYTIPVSHHYKTLGVDDPNEPNTSLKRLFANCGPEVVRLLSELDSQQEMAPQLDEMILKASVPQSDWRYCFIHYPELFKKMSGQYLRMRSINKNMVMLPRKISNGYNFDVFLGAIEQELLKKSIASEFLGEYGTQVDRFLYVNGTSIRYKDNCFIVEKEDARVQQTKSSHPIQETISILQKMKVI